MERGRKIRRARRKKRKKKNCKKKKKEEKKCTMRRIEGKDTREEKRRKIEGRVEE